MVWRRLLVPGSVRLDKLHRMFQAAMGWEDYYLHFFEIGGVRFGMQFDEFPDDELQEKEATVLRAINDARRFFYEFDFGDRWRHEVVVESFSPFPAGLEVRGVRGRPERLPAGGLRRPERVCGIARGARRSDP